MWWLEKKNILIRLANKYSTPLYVYSQPEIQRNIQIYKKTFSDVDITFCYALKANSNYHIAKFIAEQDFGADVVSEGEIRLALKAGFKPEKIIFSGVGKKETELEFAVKNNLFLINVESSGELLLLEKIAKKLKKKVKFSVRINPQVNPSTHRYISTSHNETKFGVNFNEAFKMYSYSLKSNFLNPYAIHFHLGSQIFDSYPYKLALERVLNFINSLKKINLELKYIDIGGGWGVKEGEGLKNLDKIYKIIKPYSKNFKFIMEPGRSIVSSAGLLLTKVLYLKKEGARHIVIVDAAMNDLIRPALYEAYHPIINLTKRKVPDTIGKVDIAGPVCESSDFFARGLKMKVPGTGDILAILSTGAYGYSMASNYNLRPKPAEVLLVNDIPKLIRARQSYRDLL